MFFHINNQCLFTLSVSNGSLNVLLIKVYYTLSQKRSYKHIGGSLVILDSEGKQNQKY